jgi:hypothetical protein
MMKLLLTPLYRKKIEAQRSGSVTLSHTAKYGVKKN